MEAIERRKKREESLNNRPYAIRTSNKTSTSKSNMNKSENRQDQEESRHSERREEKNHNDNKETTDYFQRKVAMLLDEDLRSRSKNSATTTKRVEFTERDRSESAELSTDENDDEDDDDEATSQHAAAFDRHERLRKICSVALDLQTKIDQTKQALERIGVDTQSPPTTTRTTKRLNDNSSPRSTRKRTDSSPMASFPHPLVQQSPPRKSAPNIMSESFGEDFSGNVPGVMVYRTDTIAMTRDLAARRIQVAYRLYMNRRQQRLYDEPQRRQQQHRAAATRSSRSQKASSKQHVVPRLPKPKIDEYNFINVLHKKQGTFASSSSAARKESKSKESRSKKQPQSKGSISESRHYRMVKTKNFASFIKFRAIDCSCLIKRKKRCFLQNFFLLIVFNFFDLQLF